MEESGPNGSGASKIAFDASFAGPGKALRRGAVSGTVVAYICSGRDRNRREHKRQWAPRAVERADCAIESGFQGAISVLEELARVVGVTARSADETAMKPPQ